MAGQDFGVVGMAVMGQNLALNVESKGFSVAVFNRTTSKMAAFVAERCQGKNVVGATTPAEMVAALARPRKLMLMVKAGAAVDAMIDQFRPLLEEGDILIDGGNSYFKDTERRLSDLEKDGLLYIGTGVSGGEEGALLGPSIMPGGHREAYDAVGPILTKIAAQVEDGPCCVYIGPRGAGHYVKMVHNGIEYGIMQLIAETYDLMARGLGMPAVEIGDRFAEWNDAELNGYLCEIAAIVLRTVDGETGTPVVDLILDKAGQKGTGKWTSQDALDVGVPTPTINAAVEARILSAFKDERVAAAEVLTGPSPTFDGDKAALIADLRKALHASVITSYAQGLALLTHASADYDYDLNLAEIAQIWKGGCIIRARMLEAIKQAYLARPDLPNLMVNDDFAGILNGAAKAWRRVVQAGVALGIPVLAFSASLAYFDSYRTARLPANMIQGLRDLFGAHTYERTDKEGTFHTQWYED